MGQGLASTIWNGCNSVLLGVCSPKNETVFDTLLEENITYDTKKTGLEPATFGETNQRSSLWAIFSEDSAPQNQTQPGF